VVPELREQPPETTSSWPSAGHALLRELRKQPGRVALLEDTPQATNVVAAFVEITGCPALSKGMPRGGSVAKRSTLPRSKACIWARSSFVASAPVDLVPCGANLDPVKDPASGLMHRRMSRHHAFWMIASAVRSGRMAYDGRSESGPTTGSR
jgi:hypothetical protein